MKLKTAKCPKCLIVSAVAVTSSILLASTPSYAISLNPNSFFNKIVGQVKDYYTQSKTELQAKAKTIWGNASKDAVAALNKSTGDMGMSDPVTACDELDALLQDTGTSSELTNTIGAAEAGKTLERETTRATVKSVLGIQGQQRTKAAIDATGQTVEDAQQLADDAQTMDASQNVLKVIAAQNAQIVSMLGQSRTDGLMSRQDAQQTNLMLSQIADNQAVQERQKRLAEEGSLSRLVETGAMNNLDPTYLGK